MSIGMSIGSIGSIGMSIGNHVYFQFKENCLLLCSTWTLDVKHLQHLQHLQVPSNSLNFPRAEARCLVPQHLPRLQGIGPRAEAITPFTGRPQLLRYVILLELRIWVENAGKQSNISNLRHQIFRVVFSLSWSNQALSKRSPSPFMFGLPHVTKTSLDSITIGHLFGAKSCNQNTFKVTKSFHACHSWNFEPFQIWVNCKGVSIRFKADIGGHSKTQVGTTMHCSIACPGTARRRTHPLPPATAESWKLMFTKLCG